MHISKITEVHLVLGIISLFCIYALGCVNQKTVVTGRDIKTKHGVLLSQLGCVN